MKRRFLMVAILLAVAGAWWLWPPARRAPVPTVTAPAPVIATAPVRPGAATLPARLAAGANTNHSVVKTNPFAYRLSNTPQTVGQLTTAPHAILLENALLDTAANRALEIPAHLRAPGEPGAYIVQARGVVDAAFRAALARAGAQIVSYIPNNAYLVQLSAGGAAGLSGQATVQAVLPFAPYFKLQPSLLGLAVERKPLPAGQALTLGLFSAGAEATVAQLEKMGGKILATDRSPFGPIVRVEPPADWIALAQLPGVQRVEPTRRREMANDLARVAVGAALDTVTNLTYLGLSGSNVVVEVNDTGIDVNHPDFTTGGNPTTAGSPPIRVSGDSTNSLYDVSGHGTHVAGIIAGNGSQSINPTNVGAAARGSITNADFRGKAPLAKLFSVNFGNSDSYLQETPARTNALISNNSWVNGGANVYDLSAASYDAAARDAIPGQPGPQPVLFVFAAGNDGGGADNGGGGNSDTVLSPGTAKNVITVGSLEQFRSITNTYRPLGSTNETLAWKDETSSGSQVAAYSARGNVGVQTEGPYGRFKPDVVAPGTFVVSTRSTTWDKQAYYNPTNYHNEFSAYGLYTDTNTLAYASANVPINAVAVTIRAVPNQQSPTPFPRMPIYISATGVPDPAVPASYDFFKTNNLIAIPPDSGGAIADITSLRNGGFTCAVADGASFPVTFDLLIQIVTTNDLGNQLEVLSNLNETLGPYYFYETGTSIAVPSVSGSLALMQDFFTNTLHLTPSPTLLKAMLINGARLTTGYNDYGVTNSANIEGWGLVNVPNSIPAALTNTVVGVSNTVPMYFLDQSPTNVLATGDSRTFNVSVPTPAARSQMLRITLAWTDPPGNPAAGVKLVNNLDLVVTNLATGAVYYGNTLAAATIPFSLVVNSNTPPDVVNNVENVFLPTPLGSNYAVTVIGRNVTVNAVTLEQTNIVQDYALVIACGDSANTNGIIVTPALANVPGVGQPITYVGKTNGIYFGQLAGANAPWLSTNTAAFGTNTTYFTNASLSIGQTNQWHFFVVTNTTPWTNAAFIVFLPNTLAIPREGVFAGTPANSTRPEADLDLFVTSPTTDPNAGGLTNLNPAVIADCIHGLNGDAAALSRGGTEFVVYSNSTVGQVYYIGVQAEDQMAGQFAFLPIFSQEPFSRTDANGNQIVAGLQLPVNIPDGNNAHPGRAFVLGLATLPMEVGGITVTNTITHQNFGDLIGILTHGTTGYAVLNNHDGLPNPVFNYTTVYNDDGPPFTHTDGPGSLRSFRGQEAIGPWLLSEIDDAQTQTGAVTGLTFVIRPHRNLRKQPFITVTVPAGSWFYDYVDVPVGYTNITVVATNLPPTSTPPILLALRYNIEPTVSNNIAIVGLTNGTPPGNSISHGPPLAPGRYFVGLFNPDSVDHDVLLGAILSFDAAAITRLDFKSTGPVPLLDDAVTYDSIFITNTAPIQEFSVGLRVDHERISDLAFHLVSPDGTRYLLMENRGGQSTNGCGTTVITTNIINVPAAGGNAAQTNYIDTGMVAGSLPITYNFYTAPDEMTVYYGTNVIPANLILDTGLISNPPLGPGPQNTQPQTITVTFPPPTATVSSTFLTIVMNQFGNPNSQTAWIYTAGGVLTNFNYLNFTEDTNQTTTPIKFAATPLTNGAVTVLATGVTTNITSGLAVVWTNGFEGGIGSPTFPIGSYFAGGWLVDFGSVDLITNGLSGYIPYQGNYFIDLDGTSAGGISTNIATVPGVTYTLDFAYSKNPSAGATLSPQAQILINGSPLGTAVASFANSGGNLNWHTTNFVFTATGLSTALAIHSLSPSNSYGGIFLDEVRLLTLVTNVVLVTNQAVANYSFQPEQSLDALIGTSPYGPWQLEVLDNRAGATNNATLVSWQLGFTFANTNFILPPVLPALTNQIIIETTLMTVVNTATDAVPSLTLSYSLAGPAGATISPTGIITWTPTEAQGPSTNIFVTTVSDNSNPVNSSQNFFSVIVLESNLPPVLLFPTNTTTFRLAEMIPFVTNALATDPDLPANTLTFALVSPTNLAGLTIATDGTISWTPDPTNAPSTNTIFISVTDTNPPAVNQTSFSVTNSFTIIVLTSNHAPVLVVPPNTNINEMVAWSALATATDPDVPTNILTFALVGVAPPLVGSQLTVSAGGLISWTPDELQGVGDYVVAIKVTDNGVPPLSVSNAFTIHVNEVNIAPVLLPQPDTNIFELTTLTVTNTAIDPDAPSNTLTYVLVVSPVVTNAFISTNGIITWTPTEPQGSNTYVFTTVVTDTNPFAINATSLSATNRFRVTVNEVNSAPFWPASTPTNYVVVAPNAFVLTNAATDLDLPTNPLTYYLLTAPTNAVIDTNTGVITWPSTFADVGSNYVFRTVVTDTNAYALTNRSLSATNTFTLTIVATNTAPFWTNSLPDVVWDELTTNNIFVTALDTDTPPNHLTYSLLNAPAGMTVSNNLITWIPSEVQGPGVYPNILVVVSDNVLPTPLTATNAPFSVTVNEVNSAPKFVGTPPDRQMPAGTTLVVTNAAVDSDIPINVLTYSLLNPPSGAGIDSARGVLTLTLLPGTNLITTVVTDTNPFALFNRTLSATNAFTVIVTNLPLPTNVFSISSIVSTNIGGTNGFLLTWFAPTNMLFQVQWETSLVPTNWQFFTNIVGYDLFLSPTSSRFTFFDNGSQTGGFGPARFYRLVLSGGIASSTNTPPVLPPSGTRFVTPLSPLNLTNTATDADLPAQTLTYTLTSTVAGTNVPALNTSTGVINWTPTLAQAGTTNTFITIVTDNGTPNLSATNAYVVIVNPLPAISSVSWLTNGVSLQWRGLTNEQFQVRWSTNLLPPIAWTLFPGIITSTNGTFSFMDTNTPLLMKFYELVLLP